MGKIISPLFYISAVSLVLLFPIFIDLTPYLRGPAPYPPDWQWTYQFSNTITKLWFPSLIIAAIIYVSYKADKFKKGISLRLLFLLIFLGFLFQISMLFYSRAGLGVLLGRIINPMLNGYFTASLTVQDLPEFIRTFNQNIIDFPGYAKFHPPGGILFFYIITEAVKPISYYFLGIISFIPTHSNIAILWNDLTSYQKFSALVSGFVPGITAYLSIIPLYLLTKITYGIKTAIRSAFLYLFIPSIILFNPNIDIFMPIFTLSSLYFFLRGLKSKENKYFAISGLILFVGTFFTLTFLPLLLFYFSLFALEMFKKHTMINLQRTRLFAYFLVGFISVPFILFYLFKLNFIQTGQLIMGYHELAQSGRQYFTWFFYNIYDFLLFAGIPIGLVLIYMVYHTGKVLLRDKARGIKKTDSIFLAFVIMLLAVNLTGAVRGETARIWIPYLPFLIIIVANFITNKLNLSRIQFIIFLFLSAVQIIVFQTVLVTVW